MQDVVSLVGRILISVIFVISGYGKLTDPSGTQAFMASAGLPAVPVLYVCTVIVELGGGILLALGLAGRWVAAVLFLFLVPVTATFHMDFSQQMQKFEFMKNLAIMGGLLMTAAFGPGRISLDGRADRMDAMGPQAE